MFFEEARELLISLEEGLMDLERRQSDRAHLDKTFRAAHSLKGAAAMVGLGSIAEFTHHIEAVLEKIRAGLLAVDSDIITTLLEARDHLAAMVEAEAARSPIPPSGELTQRLVSLLRGPSHARPEDQEDARPDRPVPPPAPAPGLSQPPSAPGTRPRRRSRQPLARAEIEGKEKARLGWARRRRRSLAPHERRRRRWGLPRQGRPRRPRVKPRPRTAGRR